MISNMKLVLTLGSLAVGVFGASDKNPEEKTSSPVCTTNDGSDEVHDGSDSLETPETVMPECYVEFCRKMQKFPASLEAEALFKKVLNYDDDGETWAETLKRDVARLIAYANKNDKVHDAIRDAVDDLQQGCPEIAGRIKFFGRSGDFTFTSANDTYGMPFWCYDRACKNFQEGLESEDFGRTWNAILKDHGCKVLLKRVREYHSDIKTAVIPRWEEEKALRRDVEKLIAYAVCKSPCDDENFDDELSYCMEDLMDCPGFAYRIRQLCRQYGKNKLLLRNITFERLRNITFESVSESRNQRLRFRKPDERHSVWAARRAASSKTKKTNEDGSDECPAGIPLSDEVSDGTD